MIGANTVTMTVPKPPKHAHIPDIPRDGNLLFEFMLLAFGVCSMGMQYINLYKTVWWLPNSHNNYAVSFHLIDYNLVTFLFVLLSRRLVWCFVKEGVGSPSIKNVHYWCLQICKFAAFFAFAGTLSWTSYKVVTKYSFRQLMFLCYPLVTYIILFGPSLRPFLDRRLLWPVKEGEVSTASPTKVKPQKDPKNPVIYHNCSSSPETIREEVETLKCDFNNRLKQILFNSMFCTYYMSLVPVCFAQNFLYYDPLWVAQQVCLLWINICLLFIIHFLPPKYLNILHCCSLHLGRWQKVEGRHAHVPYNAWSELQVWQSGSLVKHVRGLFKAQGVNITAEPGNCMHTRFHFMFHQPLRVTDCLLGVVCFLIFYEFIALVESSEWNHIFTMAFILFTSYYILFKLLRDRLILGKSYKDELLDSRNS